MRNNGFFQKTHGARRRWFWIFGGILLIAILGFLAFVPLTTKDKKRTNGPPKTKEEAIELVQRDTDEDGLKDWEEKIYGTNPEKADTDKDGTSDEEEIKVSRNPIRPGPDDKLSIPLPPPEDNNKTQALANEFIGRSLTQVIAEGIAGGQPLTELSDNPALQSYLDNLGGEHLLDKVIPPDRREFRLTQDNSPQAVKTYFNTIAEIHAKHLTGLDSDLQVLHLAATGNNVKILRRLDANIAALENIIAEIKRTPVPSEWLWFAEKNSWNLSKALTAIKILKKSEEDPVSSLLVLNDRVQLIEESRNLYLEAGTKLKSRGIAFGRDETASFLLQPWQ